MALHHTIEEEEVEEMQLKSVISSQTINNESKSLEIMTRVKLTSILVKYRVTVANIYNQTRYEFDSLGEALKIYNSITKVPV